MKFAWITAALVCLASINSADAGLFHHNSHDCGCAAPAACAPVAAPTCCAPAPTCCNSGCQKKSCWFKLPKLFGCKKCNTDCGCAQTSCAAPVACAAAAAPTCCAPAPTCCNSGCQKKSCFGWLKNLCHKKSSCNNCGCAATACGATVAGGVEFAAPPVPASR